MTKKNFAYYALKNKKTVKRNVRFKSLNFKKIKQRIPQLKAGPTITPAGQPCVGQKERNDKHK